MKECLLCETQLPSMPSWKSLFGLEKQHLICESCSNSFERADIIDKSPIIESITSLFTYNEAMKTYLHQYKFLQDIALAPVFKEELREVLKGKKNIVPIPMHPEKKIERTFSQVEALLTSADIPYIDILEKMNTEIMGEKTRQERLKVNPLFRIKPDTAINKETYVLVDDIYTTGTTLHHAARVLKEAGAEKVKAVTLIRAKTDEEDNQK